MKETISKSDCIEDNKIAETSYYKNLKKDLNQAMNLKTGL